MLVTTLLIRVMRNIDFWRGNYRDKDMPRYDLSIAIFDTIRYIVPSLLRIFYDDDDDDHNSDVVCWRRMGSQCNALILIQMQR